uniref:Uncharacterized protein n=1 Tax=Ananas comosus var. bracteatus TaxID=296719 RepID=A0A6V7QM43_ANACO|nr:unnamed protein product [Ananas comosus var. bracteatus]
MHKLATTLGSFFSKLFTSKGLLDPSSREKEREWRAAVLKEKLSALGSSGILADHQLHTQLQEHHFKGADNLYKKLYSTIPGNVECLPKNMLYSSKQHLFLVVFELSAPNGVVHEVVLYWEQTDPQSVNSRGSSVKGRDAAFLGPNENHYAILEEDKSGLILYTLSLPEMASKEVTERSGALDENTFAHKRSGSSYGRLQFVFESEVDRIFSTPLGWSNEILIIN